MNGELTILKNFKAEKLQVLMRDHLKYGRQGNLITYFLDYATLSINKTQERNGWKAASSSSPGKMTLESLRISKIYASVVAELLLL